MGDGGPRALLPGEWRFGRGPQFVTERLKWDAIYCESRGAAMVPAEPSPVMARRIRDICLRTYKLLELRDYATIDLRVTAEGRIVILEANANPGLYPENVAFRSFAFRDLLSEIVRAATRRKNPRRDAGGARTAARN